MFTKPIQTLLVKLLQSSAPPHQLHTVVQGILCLLYYHHLSVLLEQLKASALSSGSQSNVRLTSSVQALVIFYNSNFRKRERERELDTATACHAISISRFARFPGSV